MYVKTRNQVFFTLDSPSVLYFSSSSRRHDTYTFVSVSNRVLHNTVKAVKSCQFSLVLFSGDCVFALFTEKEPIARAADLASAINRWRILSTSEFSFSFYQFSSFLFFVFLDISHSLSLYSHSISPLTFFYPHSLLSF